MEQKLLAKFQGRTVKVVFRDGFTLVGRITEVYGSSFLFKTSQGTSAINSDDVRTIMEKEAMR